MADTLQVLDWKGLGMERMCGYWRRHLTSVVEEYVFRSVKKCALAEGQLASIAFLMSLSTLHPYMTCALSDCQQFQIRACHSRLLITGHI